MAQIRLPSKADPNAGGDDVNDDSTKTEQKTANDASAVQQQIDALAGQVSELGKLRMDEAAQKKVTDAADEQAQLEAEADLKALLSGGDNKDEDVNVGKLDGMTNTQLIDVIATAVDTAISAKMKQGSQDVDEKLKTTNDSIDKLCKAVGSMIASSGIEKTRGKYKDFDTYREDTLAILKKYPAMEVEDAYLLGKQLRAGDSPHISQTESERPMNTPFGQVESRTRKTENKKTSESPQHGVVGFRSLVKAAMEKTIT